MLLVAFLPAPVTPLQQQSDSGAQRVEGDPSLASQVQLRELPVEVAAESVRELGLGHVIGQPPERGRSLARARGSVGGRDLHVARNTLLPQLELEIAIVVG